MSRFVIFISLLALTPASARDPINLTFTQSEIALAYLYGERDIAENMAAHYCRERYDKAVTFGPAACTKMMPMEANRCRAKGECQ